jgi:hypothetical protein
MTYNDRPLAAEFFCGTKSMGKELERAGFRVISTDLESRFNPTFAANILDLDPHDFTGMGIDFGWFSPPCNGFSVAVIGRNWHHDHTPKTDAARLGLAILEKTIEFIDVLSADNPKFLWSFENPRGKMRKMPCVQKFNTLWSAKKKEWNPPNTVSYCQYEMHRPRDERRMKPTDIWGNTGWIGRPICKNGDPCHEGAPRGSKTGTQGIDGAEDRAIIPAELCREISEHVMVKLIGERMYKHELDYHGEFRNLFDPRDWAFVSRIFRDAFEGLPPFIYFNANPADTCQARSLTDVLKRVHQNIKDRLPHERIYKPALLTIMENLNGAKDLVKFLRQTEYKKPAPRRTTGFDTNSPTEAQKYWLRKHGCKTIPLNKAHASQLISAMKQKQGVA